MNVRHVYTSVVSEAQAYIGAFYKLDGIEGYVVPLSQPKPTGATTLVRAYNSTRDDFALFPQEDTASMAGQGYTASVTNLGYVFMNNGSRPSCY